MTKPTIRLLGGISIGVCQREYPVLSSAQARVAAARLILERGQAGVSRGELANTIWGESPPDTWESALRSIITRIRRHIRPLGSAAAITATDGRYRVELSGEIRVDVEEALENLRVADHAMRAGEARRTLDLVRSASATLEAGFFPDNESAWAESVRERLHAARLDGLELAATAALEVGELPSAAEFSRSLISQAPLRESGYLALMRARMAGGNRAEAIETFARLRSVLVEELGIDPSAESAELHLRLLREADAEYARDAPSAGVPSARVSEATSTVGAPSPIGPGRPGPASGSAGRRAVSATARAGSRPAGGPSPRTGSRAVPRALALPGTAAPSGPSALIAGLDPGPSALHSPLPAAPPVTAPATAPVPDPVPGGGDSPRSGPAHVEGPQARGELPPARGERARLSEGTAPLVGRARMLESLARSAARALPDRPRMTLVSGEFGLGKTTLLRAFGEERALEGGTVITCVGRRDAPGRCAALEALGEWLVGCGPRGNPDVEARLDAAERAWINGAPELGTLLLRALSAIAAGGEILLIVDNLDEVDEPTLEMIRAALEYRAAAPRAARGRLTLSVVASIETVFLEGPLLRMVLELEGEDRIDRLSLPRFGAVEVAEFVRRSRERAGDPGGPGAPTGDVGAPGAADAPGAALPPSGRPGGDPHGPQIGRLLGGSGGNPYLLGRLVSFRGEPATAPALERSLAEYARIRLSALGESARALLRAASLAGEVVDIPAAGASIGLGAAETSAALAELVAHELLRESDPSEWIPPVPRAPFGSVAAPVRAPERPRGTPFRLTHGALRAAICGGTPGPGAAAPEAEYPLRAADRAVTLGAPEEAVQLWAGALARVGEQNPGRRAHILSRIAREEHAAGDPRAASRIAGAVTVAFEADAIEAGLEAAEQMMQFLAQDPETSRDIGAAADLVLELLLRVPEHRLRESRGAGLGRFLARQYRVGALRAPEPLVSAGTDALIRTLAEPADPLNSPVRAEMARDLGALARPRSHGPGMLLAAHHGASAAAVQGDPELREEFDLQWMALREDAAGLFPSENPALAELPAMLERRARERRLAELVDGRDPLPHTRWWMPGFAREWHGEWGEGYGSAGAAPAPANPDSPLAPLLDRRDLRGRQRLIARWLGIEGALASGMFGGEPRAACPDAPHETEGAIGTPVDQGRAPCAADACLSAVLAGRIPEARMRAGMLLGSGRPLIRDEGSLHDAGVLAAAVVATGDRELISQLRERLLPYASLTAGVGYRTGGGPVALHLARCAIELGEFADAEGHLALALDRAAAGASRTWVAAGQLGMAHLFDRGHGSRELAESFRADARRVLEAVFRSPESADFSPDTVFRDYRVGLGFPAGSATTTPSSSRTPAQSARN